MNGNGFTHHQLISRIENLLADGLPSPAYDNWDGWNLFISAKEDLDWLSRAGVRLPPVYGLPSKIGPSTLKSIWWVRRNLGVARSNGGGIVGELRPVAERLICSLLELYRMLERIEELKGTTTETQEIAK